MNIDKLYDTDATSRVIEMKGVVVATTNRALDTEANPRIEKPDSNADQIQINIFSTYRDYEKDPGHREADILVDRRPNSEYYYKYLTNENIFIATFTKTSLITPFWKRLIYLMINLCILFTINAFMFSDEDVDIRTTIKETERDNFAFALTYETKRVLVSLLISNVLTWLFMWLFRPSQKVIDLYDTQLNEASRNIDQIILANKNLESNMKISNILLITISLIINLFGMYYVICFCGVYTQSAVGWVYGCLWGIIFEFTILTILYPLFLISVRSLMKNCKLDFLKIFLRRY